jgi:hypothetical protein
LGIGIGTGMSQLIPALSHSLEAPVMVMCEKPFKVWKSYSIWNLLMPKS